MKVPMKANPHALRFELFPGIDGLRREMDALFGSIDRPFRPPMEGESWMPALDVYEKDGEMVMRFDLPGIEKKDVKVRVLDDILTIEGERRHEKKIEEENWLRREAYHGAFLRRIALPGPVEEYEVKAVFENGVLEVRVPVKVEAQKPREIPVT